MATATKRKKRSTRKTYRVYWTIDVDAENPHDAAEQALEIQRDQESLATIFEVRAVRATGRPIYFTVDLRGT
jgi:hypothetical protein